MIVRAYQNAWRRRFSVFLGLYNLAWYSRRPGPLAVVAKNCPGPDPLQSGVVPNPAEVKKLSGLDLDIWYSSLLYILVANTVSRESFLSVEARGVWLTSRLPRAISIPSFSDLCGSGHPWPHPILLAAYSRDRETCGRVQNRKFLVIVGLL